MAAADLAHLLGGAVLVLALLMLAQRQATAAGACALQAGALGLCVAAQAVAQDRPGLWAAAAAVLALQAALLPLGLRRLARLAPGPGEGQPAAMAVGVAIVILVLTAIRGAVLPDGVAREDMAAALSVALLGLLTVVTRRGALGQMLGFLSAASGCVLAAVAVPGVPPAAVLLVLTLLLVPALGGLLVWWAAQTA